MSIIPTLITIILDIISKRNNSNNVNQLEITNTNSNWPLSLPPTSESESLLQLVDYTENQTCTVVLSTGSIRHSLYKTEQEIHLIAKPRVLNT